MRSVAVNSSVKRTAHRSFVSLTHTRTHARARAKKDTERESLSQHAELTRYM